MTSFSRFAAFPAKRSITYLLAVLLLNPTSTLADTFVTADTTQNGGVFNNNAPTLVISHLTNDPLFTLTNGASTSNVEALIVGNLDGESGQLLIEDGSSLINDGMGVIGTYGTESVLGGYAYLGLNAGSSGSANVTGPGSTWTNSGILNVGHSGNGTLDITNGGVVTNGLTYVGSNAEGVGNVTVAGTGSELISGSANIVGVYGEGNLDVLDGARVFTPTGYIGLENGSMGTVTVSGSGSTWENEADLNIGLAGTGELNIKNRGYVTSQNSDIGLSPNGEGVVNVSDVGSQWENTNSLTVGNEGTGTLNVFGGGSVATNSLDMALESSGVGTVTLSGAGSTLTAGALLAVGVAGNGTLDVEGGSMTSENASVGQLMGSHGTINLIGIDTSWENTNSILIGNEGTGTLNVSSGSTVISKTLFVGSQAGSNGTLNLSDTGVINLSEGIVVGDAGNGQFNLSNSAQFSINSATIGNSTGGIGEFNISELGTLAEFTTNALVGVGGTGTMNILDGATATTLNLTVGETDGTGDVNVDSFGSMLNVVEDLTIGDGGNGGVKLTFGGHVLAKNTSIGKAGAGVGFLDVAGNESTTQFENTQNLFVGDGGTGTVTVRNSGFGTVVSHNTYIGSTDVDSQGTVNIRNGSSWSNSGVFYIGDQGHGTLWLGLGGSLNVASETRIGNALGSVGNAHVYQGGAWENDSDLSVAFNGKGTLEIRASGSSLTGVAVNGNLFIGDNSADSQGSVIVYRPNTYLDVGGELIVGRNGTGALDINQGAKVSSNSGIIGQNSGAIGIATVSHEDSRWDMTDDLVVGGQGNGTLEIYSAGHVSNMNAEIGQSVGSTGTAYVGGFSFPPATWDIERDLNIGSAGQGSLELNYSGEVNVGRNIVIGGEASGSGTLTINRAFAKVEVGDFLDVGLNGTGELLIQDGGLLVSPGGGIHGHYASYIGHYAGSTGIATVTGDGSRWEMAGNLTIGSQGSGTFNILDGGYVTNLISYIGKYDGSQGFVLVDGAGSLWDSRSAIHMDNTSSLTVSNQGAVMTPWAMDIAYGDDSVSTVLVTGENSKLTVGDFVVSRFGLGTMTIEDGGYASASHSTLVGGSSTGIATVTGSGSHLDTNALFVGVGTGGNGTLEVSNGGLVTTISSTIIGHRAGSIGRIDVDGVGSTLHVGYDLNIGVSGDAQFNITDGGHVIVDNHAWLHASEIDPIATVSGTGSKWSINNWLFIGQNVNTVSTVDILNGGLVSVNGTTRVYNNDVLNIVGGTLRTGSLDVETGGTFNLDGGRLLLDGGVADGIMFTATNGSMVGGTGTINELMIGADGWLAPGDSPGLLHVSVAELLGEGTYQWEINSVNGQAGESIGWDLVTFETLQLSASDNDEFVIEINSLTEMNNNGRLADFDPFSSYSWLIAASDDVDPFDLESFALDLAEFDNLFFDGNFSLSTGAANYGGFAHGLFLNYTAATVPEPNSLAILLIALALANQRYRRVNSVKQNLH